MKDLLFSAPLALADAVNQAISGYDALAPKTGTVQTTDENGVVIPGVGDPGRIYYALRLKDGEVDPVLPDGCTVTEAALSEAVVGVWA